MIHWFVKRLFAIFDTKDPEVIVERVRSLETENVMAAHYQATQKVQK